MPSNVASTAIPQTQITIAAASVGASYTLVGTFTSASELMIITSTLDTAVQLSFDGVNDHVAVPAGSTVPVIFPLEFKSNLMALSSGSVFVKRIGTPTTGSLYISSFAAKIA